MLKMERLHSTAGQLYQDLHCCQSSGVTVGVVCSACQTRPPELPVQRVRVSLSTAGPGK